MRESIILLVVAITCFVGCDTKSYNETTAVFTVRHLEFSKGGRKAKKLDPEIDFKALGLKKDKNGLWAKSGYYFHFYPQKSFSQKAQKFKNNEWVLYAWPIEYGKTGNRAFAVNNADYSELYTENVKGKYSGKNRPAVNAILSKNGRLISPGNDGQNWIAPSKENRITHFELFHVFRYMDLQLYISELEEGKSITWVFFVKMGIFGFILTFLFFIAYLLLAIACIRQRGALIRTHIALFFIVLITGWVALYIGYSAIFGKLLSMEGMIKKGDLVDASTTCVLPFFYSLLIGFANLLFLVIELFTAKKSLLGKRTYAVYKYPQKSPKVVKVGFCWPGFFFSGLWLLFNKLWFFAIAFIGLNMFLEALGDSAGMWGSLALGLLAGFEGNNWLQNNLKNDYGEGGTVEAFTLEEALEQAKNMEVKE